MTEAGEKMMTCYNPDENAKVKLVNVFFYKKKFSDGTTAKKVSALGYRVDNQFHAYEYDKKTDHYKEIFE